MAAALLSANSANMQQSPEMLRNNAGGIAQSLTSANVNNTQAANNLIMNSLFSPQTLNSSSNQTMSDIAASAEQQNHQNPALPPAVNASNNQVSVENLRTGQQQSLINNVVNHGTVNNVSPQAQGKLPSLLNLTPQQQSTLEDYANALAAQQRFLSSFNPALLGALTSAANQTQPNLGLTGVGNAATGLGNVNSLVASLLQGQTGMFTRVRLR